MNDGFFSKTDPFREEFNLQKLFTTFPEGLSGFGLLILRLTIAGTIQILTFLYFFDLIRLTFRGWLIGAVSLILSANMALGFLTPVISAVIFAGGIIFLILAPKEINSCFSSYLIILSFMMIFFGPGVYSIDAKLFGRREIRI